MSSPIIYEAEELSYESSITFPRIVAVRDRYQDISWAAYKVQYFFGGCFYEEEFSTESEAVSYYEDILKESQES